MNAFDPPAGLESAEAKAPDTRGSALLSVTGLDVDLIAAGGTRNVVRGLSLNVQPGETLALVGESGGGKSLACLAIAGLLGREARVSGSVRFGGRELVGLRRAALEDMRGSGIGMIFQDAAAALNPVRTIGSQLVETLARHGHTRSADDQRRAALKLLADVGLPDPARQMHAFAHELSGGQCQRAMIALALAAEPRLLIADEPTSALDVTVQAQILDLLQSLGRERKMALLLVTHDLGVVAQYADRVAVLYAGSLVETAEVVHFFERAAHPYSRKLLAALPRIDRAAVRLANIPGTVPPPGQRPRGCPFAPRCEQAMPRCEAALPAMRELSGDHAAACLLIGEAALV